MALFQGTSSFTKSKLSIHTYTLLVRVIDFSQESHLPTKLKEKSLKYLQFLHRFEMVDYGRIVIADDSF